MRRIASAPADSRIARIERGERIVESMVEAKGTGSAGASNGLSEESVVVAAEGQAACDLAGEAVILNLASGIYFGLEGVGARVWELVQDPLPVGDIHHTLTGEYEVDADTCLRDLFALLEELRGAGLIEVVEVIEVRDGTSA